MYIIQVQNVHAVLKTSRGENCPLSINPFYYWYSTVSLYIYYVQLTDWLKLEVFPTRINQIKFFFSLCCFCLHKHAKLPYNYITMFLCVEISETTIMTHEFWTLFRLKLLKTYLPTPTFIHRLTRKLIFYFSKNFLVEPNVMPRLLHKPTRLGEFCFVWEPFPLGGSRMDWFLKNEGIQLTLIHWKGI